MPRPIGTASDALNGAVPEPLGQRFSFEELHRDEQAPAVFADLVDLADVRMVHACRRPGLAPEALPSGGVVGRRRQRLEGDRALEPIVPRRVDDTHAALAQQAFDHVPTDATRMARCGRCNDGCPQPLVELLVRHTMSMITLAMRELTGLPQARTLAYARSTGVLPATVART